MNKRNQGMLKSLGNQSGQTVVEYILVLAVVVGVALLAQNGIQALNLGQVFQKKFQQEYAKTYRYGHPDARGYAGDQTPYYHPRISGAEGTEVYQNNFRLMILDKQR